MNVGPTEDRLAIRELIETFAVGTMRIDPEIWGETWAEEGSWNLPSLSEPAKGKSTILSTFKEKMAYVKLISVTAFPSDLVVEGDKARGKAYCREYIFPKAGGEKYIVGCFDDEYVKRNGRWYFLSRDFKILGIGDTQAVA